MKPHLKIIAGSSELSSNFKILEAFQNAHEQLTERRTKKKYIDIPLKLNNLLHSEIDFGKKEFF